MLREIRITPSILNADLANLDQEIALIAEASDFLHLDIMDNIFVPNFTYDFATAQELVSNCPIPVDAHLMVADADRIGPQYAEIGCASVTVHAEATLEIGQTLKQIRRAGARAGLAVKPETEILDYANFSEFVDMFLIMTVEPGFGGQSFMLEMLAKIERARSMIGTRPIWLQVDGGISESTIEMATKAGADTFVAGSAVFKSVDPASVVKGLRDLAQSVPD